ncbi:MAG: DUF4340 domain-containing protein [Candidatus Zixiibacteriota bacterium]
MKRNTLLLLALAVVLWAIWYFYSGSERRELSVIERREFFQVDTLAVDSIAVKYASWTHLARRGGQWFCIYPDWSYPADDRVLTDIFHTTNDMVLENLISTKSEKQRTFEVDTLRGTMMEFYVHGEPVARYVVGKAGADYNHTYMRRVGSDSVYMARGDFQRLFRRVPSDWVSKTVFDLDSAQIDTIRWITAERETRLFRATDRSWRVSATGVVGEHPVDTAILNVRLHRLCPLRADAFAPEGGTVKAEMDHPGAQLIVSRADGRADTLLWNPEVAQPGGETRMYAFLPGRPLPLFIFFKGSYDRLVCRYEDLVAKSASGS